jgi:2-phospho-L-lactate/phosphoenolpyruvate guanylyltransferase
MKTVLLPVKDFRTAKQRLASALDPATRANLARAMLADVLHAVAGSSAVQRVVVFTANSEAAHMAGERGFEVILEQSVNGHSAAVNLMVEQLSTSATQILSIAGDLPKLCPGEIDFVMNNAVEPISVLPSRDGTGTNGILFLLPARIQMEYGEGSFSRHMSKAAAAGHRAQVLNIPGFAFDIDMPEDLQAFLNNPRQDSQTWQYLMSLR